MSNRTWDGKQLTASMHGFSEYSNLDSTTPEQVPVITPAHIQAQLKRLQDTLKLPDLKHVVDILFQHVTCEGNPHKTELSHFAEQIGDALYAEFIKQGGSGNRDTYLQALFETLRVANIDEMATSDDKNLLISILGARKFIAQHEEDPEAHIEIFQSILPGEPVRTIPDYALYAEFGLSKFRNICKGNSKTPYSYIGKDLMLHYCEKSDELPIDWAYGFPLLPVFGTRTNEVLDSCNFMGTPIWYENTTVLPEAEEAPDGTVTASAMITVKDIIPVEHYIYRQKTRIDMNTPKVFSIFAKPESCRYFMISFQDMKASDLMVRAIFDLVNQTCFIMNPLDRYAVDMQKLNNGWSRCILQLSHPIGQEADLRMSFFKAKDANNNPLNFIGSEEMMGYVWGMQLEEGIGASPYIPTAGSPVSRDPIYLEVPISDVAQKRGELTIDLNYRNPGKYLLPIDKPLITMWKDNDLLMEIYHRNTNFTELFHYVPLPPNPETGDYLKTVSMMEMLPPSPKKFNQLVHGFSGKDTVSGLNTVWRENTRLNTDMGNKLLIGTDGELFLDGYVDALITYPILINERQAQFLNGDQYAD